MPTRKELHDQMLQSGTLARFAKENPQWKQAFELYKQETGDKAVSIACGSCFQKVKQWLMRP